MLFLAIALMMLGILYIYSGVATVSEALAKNLNLLFAGGFLTKIMGEKMARILFGIIFLVGGIYVGMSSGKFDF